MDWSAARLDQRCKDRWSAAMIGGSAARMHVWAAALALIAIAGALSACGKCRVSSDCEPAQHCDFTTGECLDGCMTADDCAPTARCDTTTGKCIPTVQFTEDTGTSTSAVDGG